MSALQAPPTKLPTYRWPDERRLIPKQCPHCEGRLIDIDPPTGRWAIGMVTSVQCGQQLCWLKPGVER